VLILFSATTIYYLTTFVTFDCDTYPPVPSWNEFKEKVGKFEKFLDEKRENIRNIFKALKINTKQLMKSLLQVKDFCLHYLIK
jgi:hypothetical protein